MLYSRAYIIGNISETKRLSEVDILNQNGKVISKAGGASPVSIFNSSPVSIHVKISNAVGLSGAKVGCYVYGINPKEVPFLDLQGVYYQGEVPFSGDGEILLDITETGAAFIDPVITIGSGSCDVVIIVCGKD